MFNTPILLIVWRRPELFKKQIDILRSINAQRIFVAIDGEREGIQYDHERKLIRETKALVNEINWNCKLFTLIQDKNLGCGIGVSSAVTWFFSNVEKGIILEDDVIPKPGFFGYMEASLIKYEKNDKVFTINATTKCLNMAKFPVDLNYKSPIFHVWGWATYASRWHKYEYELTEKQAIFNSINKQSLSHEEKIDWYNKANWCFDDLTSINTWDYQWQLTIWKNNGYCVSPNFCLTKNLGFGEDGGGVHTIHRKHTQLIKLEAINKRSDFTLNMILFQNLIFNLCGNRFYTSLRKRINCF